MTTLIGSVAVLVWFWLVFRAYHYIRDRWAPDQDSSALTGLGAWYLAPLVAVIMPFVIVRNWLLKRRGVIPPDEQRRLSRSWAHQRRTALTSKRTMSDLR